MSTDHGAAGFCTDHGQPADRPTTDPYPPVEQSRDEAMRETIVAVLTLRGVPEPDFLADAVVTTASLAGGPLQPAARPATTPEALDALRERVAAAMYDGNEAFHAALAREQGREYQRIVRPSWADTNEYYRALYRARADAALAVLTATHLPTPQPAHDHGAAGFCTDHAQPTPDERVETVARVLHDAHGRSTGSAMWAALTPTTCRHCMTSAAAVVAALDDETARLRADMAASRAALDRVRALADLMAHGPDRSGEPPLVTQAWTNAADAIRAALGPRDRRTFAHCGFAESHEPHADRDTYCDGSSAALDPEEGTDAHVPASEQRLVLPQPPAEWLRDMSEEPNV